MVRLTLTEARTGRMIGEGLQIETEIGSDHVRGLGADRGRDHGHEIMINAAGASLIGKERSVITAKKLDRLCQPSKVDLS